jgi:hypothetical protein
MPGVWRTLYRVEEEGEGARKAVGSEVGGGRHKCRRGSVRGGFGEVKGPTRWSARRQRHLWWSGGGGAARGGRGWRDGWRLVEE